MAVENTSSVSPQAATTATTQAASTTTGTKDAGNWTMDSTVSSFSQLPEDLQKSMLLGIATSITNNMKHNQDHLKEIMDEARRDSGG